MKNKMHQINKQNTRIYLILAPKYAKNLPDLKPKYAYFYEMVIGFYY